MKLLVRNLDRSTTEDDSTTLFQEYGKMQSCNLLMDKATGKPKGFLQPLAKLLPKSTADQTYAIVAVVAAKLDGRQA